MKIKKIMFSFFKYNTFLRNCITVLVLLKERRYNTCYTKYNSCITVVYNSFD